MRRGRAGCACRASSDSVNTYARSVVVDPAFLIRLLDKADALHARCREFLRAFAVCRFPGRGRFIDVLDGS